MEFSILATALVTQTQTTAALKVTTDQAPCHHQRGQILDPREDPPATWGRVATGTIQDPPERGANRGHTPLDLRLAGNRVILVSILREESLSPIQGRILPCKMKRGKLHTCRNNWLLYTCT